jgi:hypothetical protein
VNVTAKPFIVGSMALSVAACGDSAKLQEEAALGPNPTVGLKARAWRPYPSLALAGLDLRALSMSTARDHP